MKEKHVKKEKKSVTFFQPKETEECHNQTVNVNVTIEQKEDGIGDCLKSCFGLGKKAATA